MLKGREPEKPTVEEMIAQYRADPAYLEAVEQDPTLAKRRIAILQKFRLGAKQLCARELWPRIESA